MIIKGETGRREKERSENKGERSREKRELRNDGGNRDKKRELGFKTFKRRIMGTWGVFFWNGKKDAWGRAHLKGERKQRRESGDLGTVGKGETEIIRDEKISGHFHFIG